MLTSCLALEFLAAGARHGDRFWAFAWELEALRWINGHHHPALDVFFKAVSAAGEFGICWIALIAAVVVWGGRERRREALWLAAGMIVVSACVVLPLRQLLPRDRPYDVLPEIRQLGLTLTGQSFPSGHAQSACFAAVVLGAWWPRCRLSLGVFAVLMGYSRLYCGMHYPLDVFVGAAIGLPGGAALLAAESRWRRQTRGRRR